MRVGQKDFHLRQSAPINPFLKGCLLWTSKFEHLNPLLELKEVKYHPEQPFGNPLPNVSSIHEL